MQRGATADRILHQKISFFRDQEELEAGDEREERQVGLNNEAQRKRRKRERERGGGRNPANFCCAALPCLVAPAVPHLAGLWSAPQETKLEGKKKSRNLTGEMEFLMEGSAERRAQVEEKDKEVVVL